MALLDNSGQIIATNKAWKTFGKSYRNTAAPGRVGARLSSLELPGHSWNGLDLVLTGKRKSFEATTCLNGHTVSGEFRVRVIRLGGYVPSRLMVTIEKLSDTERAGELGHRVLEIQAEERQRFATELHDSVGQYFVSLELLLSRLRMEMARSQPDVKVVQEMSIVLKQARAEIRALSYLLSPPWVEHEQSLEKAIRRFVLGFAKRTELRADVQVHGSPIRLDKSRQVTLYRIVQEALVNIYRHANAGAVAVNLVNRETSITLQVADDGTGFSGTQSGPLAHGAGLAGMRARIRHFGGELHIDTGLTGTTLTATLPIK